MSYLVPPDEYQRNLSPGLIGDVSKASSVMSDQEVEPVTRVMEVLELLMGESTDNQVRQKANQWLTEFQKSKETHRLVMEILYAALLPSRIDPTMNASVPSPSPATLEAIGHAQPGAQHQLLFFVAQTLNAKLRRAVGRAPQGSPEQEATQEIYCRPTDLLVMARRSLDLPSGPHDALGKNLALAVGQMCILDLERNKGALPEVHEVLRQCHAALQRDGDRYIQASIFLAAAQESALSEIDKIIASRSTDATFAIEIFRALATGAGQMVKARGLHAAVSISVRAILVDISLAVIEVQRTSLLRFIQACHGLILKMRSSLGAIMTGGGSVDPVLQQTATIVVNQLRSALQTYADLGELLKDILDAFNELSVKTPLPSDDSAVSDLVRPIMGLTGELLDSLLVLVNDVNFCAILAAASEESAREFCDAMRQATVTAVDQTNDFCRRARTLAERLSKGSVKQARRASDFGVAALNALPQNQHELILGAIKATDTSLCFMSAVNDVIQQTHLMEHVQRSRLRLQLVRCATWLFIDLVEDEDAEIEGESIAAAGRVRSTQSQGELQTRMQDSENTVGRFWSGDHVNWQPLERHRDTNWSSATPNELLPERVRFGGRRKGAREMDDVVESNPDEELLWAAVNEGEPIPVSVLTKRTLLMEESVAGFVLGQISCLFASLTKSLSATLSVAVIFGTLDSKQALPRGRPCGYDMRVLVTWSLALRVDLSVQPQVVANVAEKEGCRLPSLTGTAAYVLLEFLSILAMSPTGFTLPATGSLKDILCLLISGPLELPADVMVPDLIVVPYHVAYFDEPRGKASLVEALQVLVESVDKSWPITKPLRNELGMRDEESFASSWITWILEQTVVCAIYPSNYERASASAKTEIASYREDLRRLGKATCKILPVQMNVIFESLSRHLLTANPMSQNDWRCGLSQSQKWKVYEAALVVLTNVSKVDPHKSSTILSNEILLEKALSHRAVLASTLWFVGALLPMRVGEDARISIAALQLCRAALRVPQFDPAFPMTAREDHVGAVVLSSLSATVESTLYTQPENPACLEFFLRTTHSNGEGNTCLLYGLVTDVLWLLKQSVQRSTRVPAPDFRNTYCFISAASIPILFYSLGQILCCLRAVPSVATKLPEEMQTFVLQFMLKVLTLFGESAPKVADSDGQKLSARIAASLIDSITAFVLACTSHLRRPLIQRVHITGVMKLPPGVSVSWGTELQAVQHSLLAPLPERQHRGTLTEARRTLHLDVLRSILQDGAQSKFEQELVLDLLNQWGTIHTVVCHIGVNLNSNLPLLALSDLQAALMSLPGSQQGLCHTMIRDTYTAAREHVFFVPLVNSISAAISTATLHSLTGASADFRFLDSSLEEGVAWLIEQLVSTPSDPSELLHTQSEAILRCFVARESVAFFLPDLPPSPPHVIQVAITMAIVSILGVCIKMLGALPTAEIPVPAAAGQLIRLVTSPNPTGVYAFAKDRKSLPLLSTDCLSPAIRRVLSGVLETLVSRLNSVAAKRGRMRSRDSVSSASPRGSLTPALPSPATPLEQIDISAVHMLTWILICLLVQQTGMTMCPSVSQKDLGIAQNSLIELILSAPISMLGDHLEAAQNILLFMAVNNPADPLPTSPFLWSSSPEAVSQFRLDISRYLTAKAEELQRLEAGISEGMASPKSCYPGGDGWYAATMPLRRLLKRSTGLINVLKRRSGGRS
eukprot:Gregarina_sp_Poly_1__4216@NODE_22_length_20656_cov_110_706397_g20_i0_p1_GENE_NODE_22_length_20656_cov_110_706397_g20_i0NODE_22_length_20656_cov_110_706397_g20_i0_p1_ORF_typecomplete_len1700_score271_04HEAT_2/PF13646_6/5_3e02HEAT_2/PF13646_6/1_6e04HEAT_2/PF13646_6/6_3HEAT_2/PF13646_6/8_1e03_NODE_22_length_20656_cov_110_706397_g20_i01131116410